MKLKDWQGIKSAIHKDKWWILAFMLMTGFGFQDGDAVLWGTGIVGLVADMFFILFNFEGDGKKIKNIVINIVVYGASLLFIIYGILSVIIPTLPELLFSTPSSYIIVGIIMIATCLYMDYIRPKKTEDKDTKSKND